jgi:RNA polymerase sigma-70 factor (ECF subfamily)
MARPAAGAYFPREVTMDEQTLLRQLRAGHDEAYEYAVRAHSPRMLAVARRLLRQEDAAQDAVQQAWVAAFGALHAFREGAQLSTWLHRIVVNEALMTLRKRKRRPELSIGCLLPSWEADGHRVIEPSTGDVPADEQLVGHECRALVRAAIDCLPSRYRTALLLRDIEEMGIDDAASVVGITPNAFKIRVHRARQALLTLLTRSEVTATR